MSSSELHRFIGDGEATDFALEIFGPDAKLFIANKLTNEPLAGAKISLQVEGGNAIAFKETDSPGIYLAKISNENLTSGQLAIEFDQETDLVEFAADTKSTSHASGSPGAGHTGARTLGFGTGILAGVGFAILVWALSKFVRTRIAKASVVLIVGMISSSVLYPFQAFSHEGHDEAPGISEATHASSVVELSKDSQFLIGLRHLLVKKESVAEGFTSYGHVLPKPQFDAVISAPQHGIVSQTTGRALGESIRKGELLAVLETVGQIRLTSPINGQLVEISSVEGSRVEAGTKLFRVTDTSSLWVDAELYEADVLKLKDVVDASVSIEGMAPIKANILKAQTPFSEETRTAKILLEIKNPSNQVRLGSFTTISFSLRKSMEAVVIPVSAVLNRAGTQIVFVRTGPETFEPKNVVIEKSSKPGFVVVKNGVKEGERVVVSGNYQLLMKAK